MLQQAQCSGCDEVRLVSFAGHIPLCSTCETKLAALMGDE